MPVEMVLSLLQSTMPLPDEIEMLDAYDGDRALLRDVEKWLLKVKEQLPSYDKRAQALVARAGFSSSCSEEAAVVERVLATAKQIRTSKTLVAVLAKTLAIGNYLNGTSRTGGAYGFKLSALHELTSCKSQVRSPAFACLRCPSHAFDALRIPSMPFASLLTCCSRHASRRTAR